MTKIRSALKSDAPHRKRSRGGDVTQKSDRRRLEGPSPSIDADSLLYLFQIPKGRFAYRDLALHLADEYFWPNIKMKSKPRGRRPTWSTRLNALLIVEVERSLEGVQNVVRTKLFKRLAGEAHWARMIETQSAADGGDALNRRYRRQSRLARASGPLLEAVATTQIVLQGMTVIEWVARLPALVEALGEDC